MKRAVFLDRDGTLIEEKEYLRSPDQVILFPGVGRALRKLEAGGYLLVLITNQSGVGRGYFTMEDVKQVHERLERYLAQDEVTLAKIYIAPEAPGQPSRGRKPSPQFLLDARDELGIDLSQSFMIGDKLIDLECGRNAGVKKCILVRTGYGGTVEREESQGVNRCEALVLDGIPAAADWILKVPAQTW